MPATAVTLSEWVNTWMKTCADGNLVLGPLNNDTHARTTTGSAPNSYATSETPQPPAHYAAEPTN